VDEAVAFVDGVHPTHQVRPAGCWARRDVAIAVEQTTGRERLNIHGAINLETGQTQIIAVEKVNALSFIKLLGEIEAAHTAMGVRSNGALSAVVAARPGEGPTGASALKRRRRGRCGRPWSSYCVRDAFHVEAAGRF
jgi:hypothetical protein